jgi:hypothetical protein
MPNAGFVEAGPTRRLCWGPGHVNLVIEPEAPVGVDAWSTQLSEPQSNLEKKGEGVVNGGNLT